VLIAGMVLGMLAACGGTDGSATTGAVNSDAGIISRPPGNSPGATISGVPVTTAVVGQLYSFQPQATNTTGTVRFTISHLPAWAKFNSATGQLTGTPAANEVGQYTGITINLVAGTAVIALPAFSITVAAAGSQGNAVTLSWQAPTENSDGTALSDLKGYKVHYGPASKSYSDSIQVANPGLTTYVVQNLPAGKYYFAVTAYNSTGHESSLSGEVSTQVD